MADRRQQGLARILASDGAAFDVQDALGALGTYNSQLPPEPKAYSQRLGEALLTTWPAQMAKSAFQAATLPGDVYAGKVDPLSEQGIGRALDLAGLVTLSSGAFPAAKGAGQELRAGIKAYHGSPHDFDKFQLSKIGTGEGAQAYGHGLYFAENEAIAKSYRDGLTSLAVDPAKRLLAKQGNDVDAAILAARAEIQRLQNLNLTPDTGLDRARSMIATQENNLAALNSMKNTGQMPSGRMYEVNINADPAKMLDWDKRIGEQSPDVIRAFKDLQGSRFSPYDTVQKYTINDPDTVREFAQAGIPGIKYLDAGSRSAGEGSRNFVVFDDSLIDIMRKYGVGSLAALPPAVLAGVGITPDQAQAADAQRATQAAQEIVRE
jgi:hypothetical protein